MFANDLQITFHSSFQPKLAKISALKYIINYRISLKIPPALMARLCRSRFEQEPNDEGWVFKSQSQHTLVCMKKVLTFLKPNSRHQSSYYHN